jgi:hypothetical protein
MSAHLHISSPIPCWNLVLSAKFYFDLRWSQKTNTLYEAQIKLHHFSLKQLIVHKVFSNKLRWKFQNTENYTDSYICRLVRLSAITLMLLMLNFASPVKSVSGRLKLKLSHYMP